MFRSILTVAAMWVLAIAPAPVIAQSSDTMTFGIVPQQSASRLVKMWAPLMAYLGQANGVTIEFRTTADIPTFEACLAAGAFDIAYMNPIHYTIFSDVSGYNALARQEKKKLRGLIVVRRDSPISDLQELDGAVLAFPAPGAFGATVVPRAEFLSQGIDVSPAYVKSHDSVYRAVAAGRYPAGGGVARTLNSLAPEIRSQLRVIYETDRYTPHAIATAPEVSDALRAGLLAALMQVNTDFPELARGVGMDGFEPGADADWNDVRGLDLPTAEVEEDAQGAVACPFG